MTNRHAALAVSVLALVTLHPASAAPAWAQDAGRLQSTIEDVAARWPKQRHIAPGDLAGMMRDGTAVVFDVRTVDEYAISHIDGAALVDPAMSRAAFLSQHGPALKGKTAVFYCAVGVRSSKLAERVGDDGLKAAGAVGSANLAGGIFAWHGDEKPLVDAKGATDLVHGYDSSWGKLIKRQELIKNDAGK